MTGPGSSSDGAPADPGPEADSVDGSAPTDPHDARFQFTFRSPANAASFLRTTLPASVSEALDWSSLELRPGSYMDEEMAWLHSDLLFSARTRDGENLLLYILFEHQSSPDSLMAFRLLGYMHRIWTQHLAGLPKGAPQRLPAVMPVLLYHGEKKWTARRDLLDLIDVPRGLELEMQPLLPRLRYLLEDFSLHGKRDYRGRSLVRMGVIQTAG